MANHTMIEIEKREVCDFVNIDHGTAKVTLQIFHGGLWDKAAIIELNPEQADQVAEVLRFHADMVRNNQ